MPEEKLSYEEMYVPEKDVLWFRYAKDHIHINLLDVGDSSATSSQIDPGHSFPYSVGPESAYQTSEIPQLRCATDLT